MPTQEQVLEALKKVKFPGLSRDIVSFGFVRDIKVDGSKVAFTIHFQTENPAVGQQIARESEAAVRALEGVTEVHPNLEIGPRQGGGASMPGSQGTVAPQQALSGVKYRIAVASGKGGVGKSTVSTNLALSLRALGHTVGLRRLSPQSHRAGSPATEQTHNIETLLPRALFSAGEKVPQADEGAVPTRWRYLQPQSAHPRFNPDASPVREGTPHPPSAPSPLCGGEKGLGGHSPDRRLLIAFGRILRATQRICRLVVQRNSESTELWHCVRWRPVHG